MSQSDPPKPGSLDQTVASVVRDPAGGIEETIGPADTAQGNLAETIVDRDASEPPLETIDLQAVPAGLNTTIDAIPSLRPAGRSGAVASPRPQVEGYTILSELGRGGMGVVYKARQIKLNRIVALKMVLAGAHANADQLVRFSAEAEAVAQLQQPNIVQIYEVGENAGLPYFSLEFVDGGSLSERIGGKPQPVPESARNVELLARAMAYAHDKGVVHRDLKPANVLLTKDGQPKITDFGLAKRLESDSSQTKSGTLMGTPSYMAPEQARGDVHEVGPLADVYALGVILYELLTGRTPFLGASILDTLDHVRNHEPVPPSQLQPKVPRDLETICLKCLQKEPAKRYGSAAELAEDVHRFVAGEPILARPVGALERLWRWCRRNQRVAALSALAGILLLSLAVGGPVAAVLIGQQKALAVKNEHAAKTAQAQAELNEQQAVAARREADQNARAAAEQRGLALEALGTLVSKVQTQLRNTPATQKLRQDLLETGIDGLRKVAESAQGRGRADGMMAEAHQRMGDIFQRVGQHAEARRQYEENHAIRQQLARIGPDRSEARRNLAISWSRLGDICFLEGKTQLANQQYREALKLRETLAAEQPESEQSRIDLATSYVMVGKVSEPAEARSYYMQALKLREALASSASDAARPSRERDVWIIYNRLGELSLKLVDFSAAQEYYDQALSRARILLELDPKNSRTRFDVAMAQVNLGNVRLQSGERETARRTFGQALLLLRPLAKEDPRNLELQTQVVMVMARRGDHTQAAQMAKQLRDLAPQNFLNLYNIGCCYALCSAAVAASKTDQPLAADEQRRAQSYADQAAESLRLAIQGGFKDFDLLRTDPDLAAIRDHPGYQALIPPAK